MVSSSNPVNRDSKGTGMTLAIPKFKQKDNKSKLTADLINRFYDKKFFQNKKYLL